VVAAEIRGKGRPVVEVRLKKLANASAWRYKACMKPCPDTPNRRHNIPFFPRLALLLAGILIVGGCCCRTQKRHTGADANDSARPAHTHGTPAVESQSGTASPGFAPGKATALFDGKSLKGWAITDFAGKGEISVKDGQILLGMGFMTGIHWTNELPRMNYEVRLDAMRVDGSDFFCGLTFPVGDQPCSFIVGGWGGGVVGLSSIDGEDAANNETTTYMNFEKGRWYGIRVRVTPDKIEAWIDDDRVVEQVITDRKVSIRIEMEQSLPMGIATYATTAALKNIRIQPLK
jgi:hypothetical protein